MKFLFPSVTCILTSHMKPYLRDALNSVINQTRTDIQILVLDSGQWINKNDDISKAMLRIYKQFNDHPLVEWIFTGEPNNFINQKCPVAFVTNEAIRAGLVRGKYVCTFYDDDRYYPSFMETMAGYLDSHSEAMAVWCSEDRVALNRNNTETPMMPIIATGTKYGPSFDCQVDGAQIMFRKEVLDLIGDPWLPEDSSNDTCRHSDGIFLDRLGKVCGTVPAISETLVKHRFTPLSRYTPSG